MSDKYSSFEYIIPANEPLYKGVTFPMFDVKYNKPSWFSQSADIASRYTTSGGYIHEIRPKTPLRLINIMSRNFHTFIQDHINDKFKYEDHSESFHKKMQYLIPLGLPDAKTQIKYVIDKYNEKATMTSAIELFSPFFYNQHRYSHHELDTKLITLMKQLLWQHGFVGYIAPCSWTSCFHYDFHNEVCLFDMSHLDLLHFKVKPSQLGGGDSTPNNPSGKRGLNIPIDTNKIHREIYEMYGWDGPFEYDEKGEIILWNSDYVEAMVRKKRYEADTGKPYPEDIEKYKFDPRKKTATKPYRLIKVGDPVNM